MRKVYRSMIEIEKDYFPNIYQERLDKIEEDKLGRDQRLIKDGISDIERIISRKLKE